jgi:hypothetical protein
MLLHSVSFGSTNSYLTQAQEGHELEEFVGEVVLVKIFIQRPAIDVIKC